MRDLEFLIEESATTPRHNATIEIFDPGDSGFDYDRLTALIADRIAFVPRYRQRVQQVPGRLANPIWIDDVDFDLAYHVRRSALPRPGSHEQLLELVNRIVSRPLDRTRPLWEVYVVEGLADGQVALLSKTHQALVDGVVTVDLGQVLLDRDAEPKSSDPDDWRARRTASSAGLVMAALKDTLTQPETAADTARGTAGAALRSADRLLGRTARVANALTGRRPERETPLSGRLSQQRRVVTLATDLEAYRRVRDTHGGTVNDVVLATITGGLRAWLMTRAESMSGLKKVRAMVPVSVIDHELEANSLGSQIAPHFVDLPVGEASPLVRLHQVSYSFQTYKDTGRAVAANRLAGIAGFAPTTFHAIGSRVAARELRHGFQIAITNVPGPQTPLYAAGARMLGTYPVPPLLPGQSLAIGVTSYDGKVFYGITADRDLVPDAETLGQCVREALDELLETVTGSRPRAPRGRRKSTGTAKKSAGQKK
ncbi:wax ester/triacylglycerol synthase family O-acyltransferase [Nocardioides sp.]|uniref:WS/DGAT/MGAT family O-acyltransferase n=1 Tax=Nocardioides sp. TaxID=35761 RepID=UPI0035613A39